MSKVRVQVKSVLLHTQEEETLFDFCVRSLIQQQSEEGPGPGPAGDTGKLQSQAPSDWWRHGPEP